MTFQVPTSKKSIQQNRFPFTVDGKTYSIPLLKYAPVEAAEAFENDKPIRALMLAANDQTAADAIRSLDGEQFQALMDAWTEASGISPGESQASTGSSESTQAPSAETSSQPASASTTSAPTT